MTHGIYSTSSWPAQTAQKLVTDTGMSNIGLRDIFGGVTTNVFCDPGHTHTFSLPYPAHPHIAMKEDLNHPVYKATVEALVDTWCQRYGNDWVNTNEVATDDFFGRAYRRLKQLGKLEEVFLADNHTTVCRIPE